MLRKDLLALVLVTLAASLPALAQIPDSPSRAVQRAPAHRFWDKKNVLLFAGVTGARFFDYGSTIWMRHRGVDEWLLTNDIVDNHAAFAAIELAGAAASVGASYALHRTGHHKLERVVSMVHIGVATGGAIRNFTLP